MSGPHEAVKRELLVRYLDAWTPAALHRHKKATYVSWSGRAGAQTALRVFAEFADILDRHPLTMLVPASVEVQDLSPVPGLTLSIVDGPLSFIAARGESAFAWFDGGPDVSTVVGAEILAAGAPSLVDGLSFRCRVDLVAADGTVESLAFGAAAENSLERFKDALWALDEYAGIQLRDPADDELLDISADAHLGPLRRILLRRLESTDGVSLADLRGWTLHETVFRGSDTTRAVQALLAAGQVSRDPPSGRLSTDTVIHRVPA